MNRTLKIFFLLLFVSSVSFVYAQQEGKEVEKDDNLGGKGSLTEEKVNQGGKLDINKGLTAKDTPVEVAKAPLSEADRDKMRAGKDGMEKPKGLLARIQAIFSSEKDPYPDPN